MANILEEVFEADVFEDAIFTPVITSVVEHFNLVDKHVHIRSGVTEYHPVDDIYRELRFHRANDESLRVVDPFIEASGNVAKGGGKFTSRLAIFKNGWKVAPADESHTLKVTGEQISDAGESGVQIMDLTALSPGVNVSIEYSPPDTEIVVIEVPTGGAPDEIAAAVWAAVSRTLTESAGLSTEERDKLLSLPSKEENAQANWDHII